MIESEEKRVRLTDRITRWCEHTHHRNLRSGDIPGLVDNILEEFYHIRLCCGHLVRDLDEGVALVHTEIDCEGNRGKVYGDYCRDCAERYKKEINAKEVET